MIDVHLQRTIHVRRLFGNNTGLLRIRNERTATLGCSLRLSIHARLHLYTYCAR